MKKKKIIILIVLIIIIAMAGVAFVVIKNNSEKKNETNTSNSSKAKNYVENDDEFSDGIMDDEDYYDDYYDYEDDDYYNDTDDEDSSDHVEPSLDNVTMTIKEGALSSIGATLVITDNNESPFAYYKWFRIDKKENGEWIELEKKDKNYTFSPGATMPASPRTFEMIVKWSDLYGSLEPGDYRIVKNVIDVNNDSNDNNLYFSCEFTIE